MTMHKALHPRDNINRLYLSKKEGREHTSIEDCVDALVQGLEVDIKKRKERLTTATSNSTHHKDKKNNKN